LRIPLATLLDVAQVESLASDQKHSEPAFVESDSQLIPDDLVKRRLGYIVEFITLANLEALADGVGCREEGLLRRGKDQS
jgi:hypothetical protein